jgi:uncharacterized membrane protein
LEQNKSQKVNAQRGTSSARSVESVQARHNQKRSLPERIADAVTIMSGSIPFLLINVLLFAVWLILNTKILSGVKPFDPFPFPLLTTIVSLEAIFLAIFVLISQNRQMKVQDLRQEINLQIDMIAEDEVTKLMTLVRGLYQALNIDTSFDPELHEMCEPTDAEAIEKKLQEQMEQPIVGDK